jgi:outer membrane immunogenic protein
MATASANAADLPARTYTKAAPVYAAPVYNWTGFYIGGHLGGAFGASNGFTTTNAGIVGSTNNSSFLGGGQLGYNYQFAPNWVLGIEGDISGLSNNNKSFGIGGGTGVTTGSSGYLADVTGRLGYTWGPTMLYGKGGVAFRDSTSFTPTGAAVLTSTNANSTGYTVGGGLEYMFAPSWSAKVEYQYYDFGTSGFTSNLGAVSFKDDVHTVKAGVNYHF